ncbi:hypothetical protein G9A89_006674 [Geosiphon pyriformis]|nr:hypothetical protein G9A89_006674 [Geosiphon pyriformis]
MKSRLLLSSLRQTRHFQSNLHIRLSSHRIPRINTITVLTRSYTNRLYTTIGQKKQVKDTEGSRDPPHLLGPKDENPLGVGYTRDKPFTEGHAINKAHEHLTKDDIPPTQRNNQPDNADDSHTSGVSLPATVEEAANAAKNFVENVKHKVYDAAARVMRPEGLDTQSVSAAKSIKGRGQYLKEKSGEVKEEAKEKAGQIKESMQGGSHLNENQGNHVNENTPRKGHEKGETEFEDIPTRGKQAVDYVKEKVRQSADAIIGVNARENLQQKSNEAKEKVSSKLDSPKEIVNDMMEKGKQIKDKAKEKAENLADTTKEKAQNVKKSAQEEAREAKEKTRNLTGNATEEMQNMKENFKEKGSELKESAQENVNQIKEKASNTGNQMKKTVEKEGSKARENVQEKGERVKESAQSIGEKLNAGIGFQDQVGELQPKSEGNNKARGIEEETERVTGQKSPNTFTPETNKHSSLTNEVDESRSQIRKLASSFVSDNSEAAQNANLKLGQSTEEEPAHTTASIDQQSTAQSPKSNKHEDKDIEKHEKGHPQLANTNPQTHIPDDPLTELRKIGEAAGLK